MSDIDDFSLDSPKLTSDDGKKPVAITSWGESNSMDQNDIPIHLFLSPNHSESALSSSSHSNRLLKEKKKFVKETTFITHASQEGRSSKTSMRAQHIEPEVILSSTNQTEDTNSSDSDDLFASQKQKRKLSDPATKAKSKFKTNKIRDFIKQRENEKMIDNAFSKRSQFLEVPEKDERRSSAGDSSIDTELKKSITSASDVSYRDKIRDRFNTVKERAVESLTSQKLPSRKQSKPRINSLKQEEYELMAAMKRHEEVKKRWQNAYIASLEKETLSQEESNFFNDVEQISEAAAISPITEKENDQIESGSSFENQADSRITTSELLGFKDDWELVDFIKPEMKNPKNDKLWREKLFYPSTKPVSLESKLEPGLAPRFVEKEGYYVGEKIKVSKRMKNKLEQRILMTPEGRKWFGRDGELISSTSPLNPVSTRSFWEDASDDVNYVSQLLVWKPATLNDSTHRYMDLSGNLNCILDIDIHSIEFSHHPLFSREHVLAQRLKELYVKYKKRKDLDSLNRLTGRLNALRKTRDNLKRHSKEGGDNVEVSNTIEDYENDIKEVRKMRHNEGQLDKQLTNKILMTWKDLMKLREQQGYQTTFLKLTVKKIPSSTEMGAKDEWDKELRREIEERIEENKKEYTRALEEYNEKLEMWTQMKQKTESEDAIERLSETESAQPSDTEQEEFAEKEPKPPKSISSSEIKAKVIAEFKENFRQPDEPELEFGLSKATAVDTTTHNHKEEMRRTAVKRCAVFVKLFYNDKEVCRTNACPLNQKFMVKIGQRFVIQISEWPESLMLEVHEETGTLNKNLLVPAIYLPLPDSSATVMNTDVRRHEFSSKISFKYQHSGVGSGNEVVPCPDGSDYNNQPLCLYTTGIVACRLGWVDDNGKILAPPEKYWSGIKTEPEMRFSDIILSGGAFDIAKLKVWAEKSKLDPNDPNNSAFFHFLENADDLETTKCDYFRLDPLLEEFDFCSQSDIDDNVRLKVLRLRNGGEPEFSEMKMVPLNEKHFPKEIFKEYEKRISTEYMLTDVQSSDPIYRHRVWGKKYLEQIQQKLLKQCRVSMQKKRYQDIIIEESVPDIGTLGLTFMKWLHPKRPLRPVRKERKKIAPQSLTGQEVKIVVNVVRAFEVPIRKDVDSKSTSIEGFSLVNVRPFVEISFQGVTARTTAAEGANPTWNQNLQISLKNKNGYFSAGNFQSIKDSLYLHLFDEIVVDLIEDESARETNIHQRLERHWLASMEIPFSTLYFNSRIEGTFKLYSPPILLGYEREAHRLHFSGTTNQESLPPQRDATFITLFVTVQPALNPPKPIKEKMECSEAVALEEHLEGWTKAVASMFPHRKIKTLVLDITGKSICATRFVRPLPLPPITDERDVTPEMIARFVAMIPLVTKSAIFPEYFDIWLTGDQILRLLSGDAEDHATLLCCYFLQLGLEAYVLLGSGIPHGSSAAYVLVKEMDDKTAKHYVWDPINGQKYSVDDSFCPLQKVYCLINDKNIWANLQTEEIPRRTRFDLTKRADWFPAFGKNILAPPGSAQPQLLEYKTTSRQAMNLLQEKIEKKLRDSLMKWRRKNRTQWNRYCAATLRKLLPKLEQSTWNNSENENPNHLLELQHILASHKMCGFPINMAFTRIEAVTEAVKATGVHCNEGENVEFALAVYIHPYPNNVLSVWIYVASLIRRR